jgi:hypothetical protein
MGVTPSGSTTRASTLSIGIVQLLPVTFQYSSSNAGSLPLAKKKRIALATW